MNPPLSEGDIVTLLTPDGRPLDQGNVLAINAERTRALVRWTAAGGLRCPQWVDVTPCLRRSEVAA